MVEKIRSAVESAKDAKNMVKLAVFACGAAAILLVIIVVQAVRNK